MRRRTTVASVVSLLWTLLGCGSQRGAEGVIPGAAPTDGSNPSMTVDQSPAGMAATGEDPSALGGGGAVSGTSSEATGGDVDSAPDDGLSAGEPTLGGCRILPVDNPWNTDVSDFPVHSNSDAFIDSIGLSSTLHADFGTEWQGAPLGIPFNIVNGGQARVSVSFDVEDESDSGPYPIPPDAAIEGGPQGSGDRHVLVLEADSCTLYELFDARPQPDGGWQASSGAVFDLNSNTLRPDRYTSADAAGLPILPGLVRYDEVVERAAIPHALRFTVSDSQSAYIAPATHAASNSSAGDLPPMGLRLRMRADYDCSDLSAEVQVICTALKRFGMFVADNGSNWFLSGAHDPRWEDGNLADLGEIPGSAFEVIDTGTIIPY